MEPFIKRAMLPPLPNIVIRTYSPPDVPQIKALFVSGMHSNMPAFFNLLMFRSKIGIAFWVTMSLAAAYFGIRSLYILLPAASLFPLGVGVYLQRMFTYYTTASCESDLSDIDGVYIKQGGTFFVATCSNDPATIVGIVAGEIKENGQLELRRMSVSVKHHKRGIGSKLIKALEEFAKSKGINTIFLTCTSLQYAAHTLYRRNGFVLMKAKETEMMSGMKIYFFEKKLM
jgi:GNAT superfamily N-acetyltransferase